MRNLELCKPAALCCVLRVWPVEGHHLLYLHVNSATVISVRSHCISALLASSVRGVCQGLEQPVTFQTTNTHTALRWRLPDTHQVQHIYLWMHMPHKIRTCLLKSAITQWNHTKLFQHPANLMYAVTCLSDTSSPFFLSLSAPLSLPFFHSHMQTHSVDQCPQIGLMARRPSADSGVAKYGELLGNYA